jgi:hypothetical protein
MGAAMAPRSSDAELAGRVAAALELLSTGAGSAFTASVLAERYGVSLRQARRYVSAASFELCDPATPAELDRQAMLSLHRLDLIAGRAMAAGDDGTAVRATRAHAAALAQFRRAITAPVTRFRLPTSADCAPRASPGELPPDCPF